MPAAVGLHANLPGSRRSITQFDMPVPCPYATRTAFSATHFPRVGRDLKIPPISPLQHQRPIAHREETGDILARLDVLRNIIISPHQKYV